MFCPGIGDDTANLAVLLMLAKYVLTRGLRSKYTVVFAANSCAVSYTHLDLAAAGFLIGQGIGRWGNFVNVEAFGSNTNSILGMTGSKVVGLSLIHICSGCSRRCWYLSGICSSDGASMTTISTGRSG